MIQELRQVVLLCFIFCFFRPRAFATRARWTCSFKLELLTLYLNRLILLFTAHCANLDHPVIYTGCSLREPYSEAA